MDFEQDAETLARYRLTALAIIRQTDKAARRMFLADLREPGRKAFPEMQLLAQLFAHFAPLVKQRLNLKGHPFEEVVPPVKFRNYTADLSNLGAFCIPPS